MTTATVFIINGRARSGKDTLAGFMTESYQALGHPTFRHHTIDPIRQVLTAMGIDVSAKNQNDRMLLATVATAVEEHSRFRSKSCVQFVLSLGRLFPNPIVFVMIREPVVIERVQKELIERGYAVHRVLVHSDRSEKPTNPADAGAHDMSYDFLVHNVGTLGDLAKEAQSLVNLVQMRREVRRAS